MKKLLKDMVRPLWHYINNPSVREFLRIHDKWGGYERRKRVSNVKFLSYSFDVPDLPSFVWQFKELFVDKIYKFESTDQSPVIYDCGANIGMSCLYFKNLYPSSKIIAFEADKAIADTLGNNLLKNDINNIKIINKAVWINNDGVEFGADGADGGSINCTSHKVRVGSIRLKEYLNKEKKINLLKIDIEGAEHEVLQDCRNSLHNVEHIFIEYHSWNSSNQKLSRILNILEESGFRYYMETISSRKLPFINRENQGDMDLQLNIFGVRE